LANAITLPILYDFSSNSPKIRFNSDRECRELL
jgi:hypothetical protein